MATHEVQAIGPRKIIVQITRAVTYLVYFYLIAVEIILLLGFFLLLFGANSSASFTQWAYRNLDRVMEPFRGIFAPIELGTTSADVQAVFDTAVLFAMIVYGIIAIVISCADHMVDRSTAVSRGGRSRCRVSPGARSAGCRGASTGHAADCDDLPPDSGRPADCGTDLSGRAGSAVLDPRPRARPVSQLPGSPRTPHRNRTRLRSPPSVGRADRPRASSNRRASPGSRRLRTRT